MIDLRLSDFKKNIYELLFVYPLYSEVQVNTKLTVKDEVETLSNDEHDTPMIIKHTNFNENTDYVFLKGLLSSDISNVYGYCPFCKKEVFITSKGKELEEELQTNLVYSETEIHSQDHYDAVESFANDNFIKKCQKLISTYFDFDRYFVRTFECTSKFKHKFFVAFHLTNDYKLIKVGQYPSIVNFDKSIIGYKKTLSSNDFRELNRAIGLKAHGIGIGSFVYLRRIFENLVEGKLQSYHTEDIPNKMEDKVKFLQNQLPRFLVDNNKTIYGVLSKGIHELNEQECLQYFETLKDAIFVILEENRLIMEREQSKVDISKSINRINQTIKKKN